MNMTAIWQNDVTGWHLLVPTGFPNKATLHDLVEKAPHLLPLAGTPQLIVLGREVRLGNGYADLIAIEPTGRLVIIEIKLAKNAEARRAVIAQALAYAAYLWGTVRPAGEGQLVDGAGDFSASLDIASEASRLLLQRLTQWAIALKQAHLVKLSTYYGKAGILTLLPSL
jgi:hypothetical protein